MAADQRKQTVRRWVDAAVNAGDVEVANRRGKFRLVMRRRS
jgi:hypothetical protein